MNLVVTGASGIIGDAFINLYSDAHNIVALTRSVQPGLDTRVSWVETSYTFDSLCDILSGKDAIVHMAGTRLPSLKQDSFNHYLDNITISDNIFKACVNTGVKNVVCASSRSVYSDANELPWREAEAAIPASFYGASKLAMEAIASIYSKKHGLNVKCLRIAQILSADEQKGYLLRTLFDRAKTNETQTIYGAGKGKREYIYVKDAARSFMCALQSNEKSGVYNIGAGNTVSISELAEIINRVFGNLSSINYLADKPEDLSESLMDCSKAEREFGFKVGYSMESAIEDIFGDWSNNK